MKTVGVTGTTGFIGTRLIGYQHADLQLVNLPLRNRVGGNLDLAGFDAVIHLVGKAHDMKQADEDAYFHINYELTRQLADRAMENGVKHFVYVSSTKVYGDQLDGWFDELSLCAPTDAYGRSKLQAEQYLRAISGDDFGVAIVRPPLVYGPGAKGNMLKLLRLSATNYPLPLGRCGNARSMVFIDNLVELLTLIVRRQATGIFIAGDREPVSTDKLISLIRGQLGNRHKLFSMPVFVRGIARRLKPDLYMRLFGSFVVDNSRTNQQLGFEPNFTIEEGVRQMVDSYVTSDYAR